MVSRCLRPGVGLLLLCSDAALLQEISESSQRDEESVAGVRRALEPMRGSVEAGEEWTVVTVVKSLAVRVRFKG